MLPAARLRRSASGGVEPT